MGQPAGLRAVLGRVGVTGAGVLDIVDLTSRAGDRAATYSLGMKQRLGVAAALLKDPELLILDEPTNGLDPAGMADMRALVRRLGSEGRTVLLSSHLLGEVQQVCDRVGVITGGRLLREGTVDELRGQGALRVVAEPLEQARAVAQRLLGPEHVSVRGDSLMLETDQESAPRIKRELVMADVSVRSLSWDERSLEQTFLELTNQNGQPAMAGAECGL